MNKMCKKSPLDEEKERRIVKFKPSVHQKLLEMGFERDESIGDVIEYLMVESKKIKEKNDGRNKSRNNLSWKTRRT